MPEKAIETADLKIPKPEGNTCGTTVWMDYPMLKDLNIIDAYEHMKRGPLMRMLLVDKIRCYKRNPAFKRFLVQLRQGEEDKKHKGGKGGVMGYNCVACGALLKPDTDREERLRKKDLIGPRWKVGLCPKCHARYLILEGDQPRIYLHSVIICFDDAEGPKEFTCSVDGEPCDPESQECRQRRDVGPYPPMNRECCCIRSV